MNALKAIGGAAFVAVVWILAMLVSCVFSAIPIAIGITIIALFGRAIGAF